MSILAHGKQQKKEKKRKIPNQRVGEKKRERKFPIKENRRNMQKGLWTRQYLNNTELSPSKQENYIVIGLRSQ